MRILWDYIKGKGWLPALLGLCTGIFALVLSLYDLQAEAAGYAGLLCLIVLSVCAVWDFVQWRRRLVYLESIAGQAALLLHMLPEPRNMEERIYRELLSELNEERRSAVSALDARLRESVDYYKIGRASCRERV